MSHRSDPIPLVFFNVFHTILYQTVKSGFWSGKERTKSSRVVGSSEPSVLLRGRSREKFPSERQVVVLSTCRLGGPGKSRRLSGVEWAPVRKEPCRTSSLVCTISLFVGEEKYLYQGLFVEHGV